MKPLTMCLLMWSNAFLLSAQEAEIPATGIPGPIADGKVADPLPLPPPPNFVVKSTITKEMYVEESPELVGLPPVRGMITTTVQLVEDPGLPDLPEPLPPLPVDDPAVQARIAEARARYKETEILFVSARVVDYDKTILEVYPNGQARERVEIVSSIDYNDFSGFGTFNVAGKGTDGADEVRQYALIMSISNEITANMQRFAAKAGRTYDAPELPEIPDDGTQAYVVTEGDNEEALQAIDDMHTLYSAEGDRMHASRIAREKAYEARKAYLLANPPSPKDVTIQVWSRTAALENSIKKEDP